MTIPNYDALSLEPEMLKFWLDNDIYVKAQKKSSKGKDFYFLDGPPYTSGKVHIGTAWNKSMKDMVLRYKRMQGFNVFDRAGYDMHGLPTAHAVMKKLKMSSKDEIPKFGVDKFIKECIKLSVDNMKIMNKDFSRLGIWMDFENAYQSIDPNFIEGEWWLIKKAFENKRLYEGEKTMHWCASCGTALAKHELEYQTVTDDSIFLKFPVKGKKDEYLIIWTTTPWTIPFNLAVMVNPDEEYVRAKVGKETWIVAGKLAAVFIQGVADQTYKVLEAFKGVELDNLEYENPLYNELKVIYDDLKENSERVHTVLLSKEYVDTSSGTGLVHCAPGCGPEDYEVGHAYKIPPFNNLDENGVFPKNMGKFKSWKAKTDDKKFIDFFKKSGSLIESTPVEHEYAHCWRCHEPVIFRTTKQWFFKIEDLKEKMRDLNKKIFWQPDWAGSRQFDSWLDNLRDNSITRQRYWGCPVPIWKCSKCEEFVVVGSLDELKELGGKIPKDLHIPWIDEVHLKCKCNAKMNRIPDILDVWVDAGTTSWTCLDFPQKKDLFDKLWPADFILEGKDQIRGWFNLLFVAGMVSMDKPSYKAVYMHGFVNDAQGRKMSKSLGNYILPKEVVDKYGADTLRYYTIGGANPGNDLNYNFDDMKLKHRNLTVLWNVHRLLLDLAKEVDDNPIKLDKTVAFNLFSVEEQYILSRLNSTIQEVTKLYNDYKLDQVPLKIEKLFLQLSRTYIQLVRDKAAIGSVNDKKIVLYTIFKVLSQSLVLLAPVAPFVSEAIYQNLKNQFSLKTESIHLVDWIKPDKKLVNKELENNMDVVGSIIQATLAAREKLQLGLRWPLKEVVVTTTDKDIIMAVEQLGDIIKSQTNVKEIKLEPELPGLKSHVKADFAKLGPLFGSKTPKVIAHVATQSPETILSHLDKDNKYIFKLGKDEFTLTKDQFLISRDVPEPFQEASFRGGLVYVNKERTDELEAEGYAREAMRRVQSLRKNAGLNKSDDIVLYIKADDDFVEMLLPWKDQIQLKCGAKNIKISELKPSKKHDHVSLEKVKSFKFEIMFDKL